MLTGGYDTGKTNFFHLLGALLFLLLALPLAQDLEYRDMVIVRAVVFSVLLLVGIWSLKGGGRLYLAGMVFVVAGIVLSILVVNLDTLPLKYASILAMLGFLVVAIIHTLRQVVFGTELNANRLVGAVCVFLLLGLIWAFAYSLLELVAPDSFRGFSPGHGPGFDTGWIYFSFVTLTTLGYGDITPVTATARTLAYMQAIAGQFYVAVLVAGLVSAYISHKQRS
jgi:hypothetical protein